MWVHVLYCDGSVKWLAVGMVSAEYAIKRKSILVYLPNHLARTQQQ